MTQPLWRPPWPLTSYSTKLVRTSLSSCRMLLATMGRSILFTLGLGLLPPAAGSCFSPAEPSWLGNQNQALFYNLLFLQCITFIVYDDILTDQYFSMYFMKPFVFEAIMVSYNNFSTIDLFKRSQTDLTSGTVVIVLLVHLALAFMVNLHFSLRQDKHSDFLSRQNYNSIAQYFIYVFKTAKHTITIHSTKVKESSLNNTNYIKDLSSRSKQMW